MGDPYPRRPCAAETAPLRVSCVGVLALAYALSASPSSHAIETALPFYGADQSRVLLGDGTGVIIGFVDGGIDSLHPFLAGNDSHGQTREVARANFVTSEPANTGDDVGAHGTAVAGVALANGELDGVDYTGLAPDARYINARVLDGGNAFSSINWVVNGAGFAVAQGADVINMSLFLNAAQSDGNTKLDLMIDYLVDDRNIFVAMAAGNFGNAQAPHGIGAARNGVSMGALSADYSRVAFFSSSGYTSDGRGKPDLVAPGQSLTTLNAHWDTPGAGLLSTWSGTSFASPQAAGMAAQMIEYGRGHGLSTDVRVLKAVLLNSAAKTLDNDGAAWSHDVTHPLDNQQGAGRIDAVAAAEQYLAGPFSPGIVSTTGWALEQIAGGNTPLDTGDIFTLDTQPAIGTFLDATLVWNRHILYTDLGEQGVIDAVDSFNIDPIDPLDNLDLHLFRDGVLVSSSASTIDNVEHLQFLVDLPGVYDLRVSRMAAFDAGETYALAWHAVAVPEPAAMILGLSGVGLLWLVRRRRQPA